MENFNMQVTTISLQEYMEDTGLTEEEIERNWGKCYANYIRGEFKLNGYEERLFAPIEEENCCKAVNKTLGMLLYDINNRF